MQKYVHSASILFTILFALSATAEESDYVIPEIPRERIQFRGTGYPIIPGDVQELITKRDDVWHRMSQDALNRAMPEIERWEKLGKPFIRVARQPADLPQAKIPAFPGAEGGGMYSFGGRGGKVFVVTTLADHGPGSFREACEAGGPRVVVFNVAGIIQLERPLDILAPYITIAGQTAPGDGVCVAGHSVHLRTHDIVIRYMRFRRGITDISNRDDTLSGDAIGNVIIDHCSVSWGNDETLSIYRQMYAADPSKPREREKLPTMNNTIQWTIVSESLDTYHHGFGATWGGDIGSFHHNLLAHCAGRNWSLAGGLDKEKGHSYAGRLDIRNNVVYNWKHRTTDGGAHQVNFVNNYYKPGPASEFFLAIRPQYAGFPGTQQYYVAGNVMPGHFGADEQDKARQAATERGGQVPKDYPPWVDVPFFEAHVRTQTAEDAYLDVLADVGCNLPALDPHDQRVIAEVRAGTASHRGSASGLAGLPDSQDDVGGWDNYPEVKRPADWDIDADGMPGEWERRYRLDPRDPADGVRDSDRDGYTNVEEFLNQTDPNVRDQG